MAVKEEVLWPCHELQPSGSEQGLHIPYNKPHLLKPDFGDLSSTFICTVLESSAAGGSYFYNWRTTWKTPDPAFQAVRDFPMDGQDAIGHLGHMGTLLAPVHAAASQYLQVPFCLGTVQPLCPQPVVLQQDVIVAKVQDLALGLVKPHIVGFSPSIQPVQVALQSSLTPSSRLTLAPNLVSSADLLMVDSIPSSRSSIKILNRTGLIHRSLGDTTSDWPPAEGSTIHHHHLGLGIQPVLNLEECSHPNYGLPDFPGLC
ncbi:hypothetical protein DUI87_18685 [Hirundo rustica rustica]|uniref:Uncharacterized protein n=1 Tax=Hirundo rustica rustica TaxID=333673 RepID=A0A3M0JWR2_HIRRU|nr:hypothetical protein DUI87_18685 [Hirundo rustica rustica]